MGALHVDIRRVLPVHRPRVVAVDPLRHDDLAALFALSQRHRAVLGVMQRLGEVVDRTVGEWVVHDLVVLGPEAITVTLVLEATEEGGVRL